MKDLIERQAAIEAIEKHIRTAEEPYQLTDADKVMNHAFEIAASCVYNLSETEADVPDINDGDMISRQAVIDAINGVLVEDESCKVWFKLAVKNLPSAQPEKRTEKHACDCISRQAAIDELDKGAWGVEWDKTLAKTMIESLPPAQPEIIYCKDCVKHNKGLGNYEVHPDGSSTWIWKDSACPLVSWRDKAQGHEFDYQFCAYAERRDVTE